MTIKNAFEKAGMDTVCARLKAIVVRELQKTDGNINRAMPGIVHASGPLLREWAEQVSGDMKNPAGGGQNSHDDLPCFAPAAPVPNDGEGCKSIDDCQNQAAPDPITERDGDTGHITADNHAGRARPSQPNRNGEGGHGSSDAKTSHAPSRSGPTKPKRGLVAMAAANKSIFDRKVGGVERRLGSVTLFDLRQDERKATVHGHIRHRLMTEISFPDDNTPLEKCADEKTVEAIFASAQQVLDRMELTNVGR